MTTAARLTAVDDAARPAPSERECRARRYHRARRVAAVVGHGLELAVLVILLATGWTISLRAWAERGSRSPALSLLIYLLLVGLMLEAASLPSDFAAGFWLERRYGLASLSFATWAKDRAKGLAVGGALAVLGLEFLYWTLRRWPAHWWLITATAFIALMVLLAALAPVLLLPLFYEFTPLENPALVERLTALAHSANTRIMGVWKWKLSQKSNKANAAVVGLAGTRRMIVADTLLDQFTADEVEAVLAHELGHHVGRHLLRGLGLQAAAIVAAFYLLKVGLDRLTGFFGFRNLADFANLPLVAVVITLFSLLMAPLINAHSRWLERQADAFALRLIPRKGAFISSLEKLARLNLAERKPHPWIEFIFYSHPSIENRIALAKREQD